MERYGVLAQAAPGIGTVANLYWVPRGQRAEKIRIISCNRAAMPAAVRIAVVPEGVVIADEHYIAFDKEVPSLDTVSSVEISLGERSVVRVTSDTGEVSFSIFGNELTA